MHDHGDVPVEAHFLARTAHLLLEPRVVASDDSVRTHLQFRQFYSSCPKARVLMHSSTPTAMMSKLFGIHSSRLKGGSHSPMFQVPVQIFSDYSSHQTNIKSRASCCCLPSRCSTFEASASRRDHSRRPYDASSSPWAMLRSGTQWPTRFMSSVICAPTLM